jgi:uncharacterized protein (TIGR02217 family)
MPVETLVHDVRLTVPANIQMREGPIFDSDNTAFLDGQVQSVVKWPGAALWEFWLTYLKTSEDFQDILGFFLARWGMGYGFRLASPVDYQDEGRGYVRQIDGVYRLVKEYPDSLTNYPRLITAPIAETVDLTDVPGTPVLGDYGIITGASDEGAATFQFDVPVKFMSNMMQPVYQPRSSSSQIVNLVDVHMRELRRWRLAS